MELSAKVLVIGAYGLIGSAVARQLLADGFSVTGLGRNETTARSVLPDIDWIIEDLRNLRDKDRWRALLEGVSLVVNCAGALQQSRRDDLDTVHGEAIKAMADASKETGTGVIQISAVGVAEDATTSFMRTKAKGDAAIRNAGIRYWIFRPGLVLAPTAYGGSVLLRMLAGLPIIQPLAYANAQVQTVALSDVTYAVSQAATGNIPESTECDLVEDTPHDLRDVVAATRRWLGFNRARFEFEIPLWLTSTIAQGADFLGILGWRSPLRSTSMRVLEEGILGDPQGWKDQGGKRLKSMDETLKAVPATVEDRLFARMALLMPVTIAVLFVFWLVSGLVGLFKLETATQVLENAGWPYGPAAAAVAIGSLVDIALGFLVVVRKYAPAACWAMIVVSLFYLTAATLVTPQLWGDPLGPLVKVVPGIALALIARAMLETR